MKLDTFIQNDCTNFELKDTFECGQCFRWKKEVDGSYTGVVSIGVINVLKNDRTITFKGIIDDSSDFKSFCTEYFDLERNYDNIQKSISKDDSVMKKSIENGKGIRILNQDSWEMLISFIISAANNIPRISKCIENISKEYGKKIVLGGKELKFLLNSDKTERVYYFFPTPVELSKANIDGLRECNLGFRDKYVYEAALKVANREISLENIRQLEYESAKKELMKIEGVGSKVADCILLFSMQKTMAFPVDTWIKKIMNEVYIDSTNVKKINEYALSKWGENAGIAQQYLFNYYRNIISK